MSGLSNAARSLVERYQTFWQGPELSYAQVSWFRFIFFALLTIDAFLLVAGAPRYGAGDFNVSHFPALDGFLPTFNREAIVVSALVMTYLAMRTAVGVATRHGTILFTALYAAIYFSSQLDSFQHHVLLIFLLASLSLLPDSVRSIGEDPADPIESGWVFRLIFFQVSVVYLFAAISKMESAWWDGRVLEEILSKDTPAWVESAIKSLGFGTVAKLTVVTELFLALSIHVRKLRLPCAAVGIAFHAGIQLAGFRIGLFSYYMIGFYLLIAPPGVINWAHAWLVRSTFPIRTAISEKAEKLPLTALAAAAAIAGLVLVGLVPLDGALIAAFTIFLAGSLAFFRSRKGSTVLGHLIGIIAIVTCAQLSDGLRDHYRKWGGSARRLGDTTTAIAAYKQLTELEPGYAPARRNLGKLYLGEKNFELAFAEFEVATEVDSKSISAYIGLAESARALGRYDDALYHVRYAIQLADTAAKGTPGLSTDRERAVRLEAELLRR